MKPMLFNTDMVRAILEGRKTVTRRVIKNCPEHSVRTMKPYEPGDILYVREKWCNVNKPEYEPEYYYFADTKYAEDYCPSEWKWSPSIHMPKEAARIFLRVKGVRVERLQDITEEQAGKEGIDIRLPQWAKKKEYNYGLCRHIEKPYATRVECFKDLWDTTINPSDRNKYGWVANPWVWVVEFERISKEEAGGGA